MPEKQLAAVTSTAPFLIFVIGAAAFGVVAQIGTTLALRLARSNAQLLGFCLLSLVFSGGSTVLLTELLHFKPAVAATIGALLGAVPSLITLRVGLKAVGERYGLPVDGNAPELDPERRT